MARDVSFANLQVEVMVKLGFGIVGCGMIAQFHAKAIKDLKQGRLVGCYSSTYASAERFAGEHSIKPYAKLEELLSDPAIDVVCICTPSGAHLEPGVLAAAHGKHLVVEKPMEITLKRCDALLAACEKHGVLLCPVFPSRFSPASMELKEAITAGRFERMTLADTYVKWWRTQQYYDSGGWRGTWELDGGGAFMNQAIHNVDLLYWLAGEITEVNGLTSTLAHERIEVEDTAVATVRFASGALGVLEAATSAWPGLLKRTEIHGTAGTVIIEQDNILKWEFAKAKPRDKGIMEKYARVAGSTGGASDPKAISYRGHYEQLKDFVKAIQTGTKPQISGPEGRKAVEIVLAIYQSAWTGKLVQLPLKKDPKRPGKSS
jgi:UDP-N-acetyl-2-amino-2-deoxyglucuronate dehydrogenase